MADYSSKVKILSLVFLSATYSVLALPYENNDDYEYSDEPDVSPLPICEDTLCKLPNCSCFGRIPQIEETPQFVMLTFDDAITVANIDTYRNITKGRPDVKMTFFVCHEYNDYSLTNQLYKEGHEIAVHSISHESNTDLWRNSTEDKWKKEMSGMRQMLSVFAGLPAAEIVGHRAPFLQSSGDTTFRVLSRENFLYDSSMPSRAYMQPPVWPYTLDYGFAQDCQIEPCPTENFPGLWIVPMIQYQRTSKDGDFYCSMIDACTPQPKDEQDTLDFLMANFQRHYKSNKAPFPVFLHEAWLRDKKRLDGYLRFIDEVQKQEDVFLVTVKQVVEWMKNPIPANQVRESLKQEVNAKECKPETCSYKSPLRLMKSCVSCPKYYPWVGTPLGRREPRDFPDLR